MSYIRHPEFDAITAGWGGDSLPDLTARMALLNEWAASHHLTPAETKIKTAMGGRIVTLSVQGGLMGDAP